MDYTNLDGFKMKNDIRPRYIHPLSRSINLNIPSRTTHNFNDIFQLAPQYLAQALQLASYFQGAINPQNLSFDFNRALQIANSIPGGQINATINETVVQQTLQISSMISHISNILRNRFRYFAGQSFLNEITAAITNTFTNLNTQTSSAWVFWSSSTSTATGYYYNILFAITNFRWMVVLPVAVDIYVNVRKEKVLWFTIRDTAEYRVTIKAIEFSQIITGTTNMPIVDVFNT
ncbi:TPA: hypothetical protein QCX85_005220 [Bacillus toyonensis]|uniref:hypothetical protein n=1 Tax=Bacillus toyonensis TaxID=155322 RepID=UPI001676A1D8|nr:hypothetical protein [Bacillus toyonensis]HDR7689671.1 hypothetical protein [Bacillus toyonensis]